MDFILVFWRFLILDFHELWQYKIDDIIGGKPKISQITGGKHKFTQITRDESTIDFVIWCHKDFTRGQNQKNLQITRTESKKKKVYSWKTENSLYYSGKTLLSLIWLRVSFVNLTYMHVRHIVCLYIITHWSKVKMW